MTLPASMLFLAIFAPSGSHHCSFSYPYSPCYQNKPFVSRLGPSAPCLCEWEQHPGSWFGGRQCWDRSKRKAQERTPTEVKTHKKSSMRYISNR